MKNASASPLLNSSTTCWRLRVEPSRYVVETPASAAADPSGQERQQRVRHRLLRHQLLEEARLHPAQEAGQSREAADGLGALGTSRQVPFEREPLARGERAEDVGGVVVGEPAAHALTPISSSASFSARSA